MLVLTRKSGESSVIVEPNIVIAVLEVRDNRARIGVDAPAELRIFRREVWERIQKHSKDPDLMCASPPAPDAVSDALP